MAPPGMHLCRFCGSLVPEDQYRKHRMEAARKAGLSVAGSSAAYRRAKKAASGFQAETAFNNARLRSCCRG
jgi:hypothetical protein